MSLFNELKRRNVFKVAAAYVIVAWLLLQVSDTLVPALHLPEWFHSGVAFVLILGFPVAIIFAWAFEMTPEGIKKEKDIDRSQSITNQTSRKLDFIIIGVLVLALGYFGYDKFVLDRSRDAALVEATAQAMSEQATNEEGSAKSDKSIAVLPFVNMSSDPEQEFFSDGISEELLNLLAQIPKLRVIARTSSFAYKGKDVQIAEVARELNVDHVLEGSVRKEGNQVRITAQLIRASDSSHIWSETYDRTLDNIFAIQDEIAATVVAQLKITLLGAAPTIKETNPEAYALFLQGRHLSRQFNQASLEQALVLLQQALEIDPGYAAAWDQLSDVYRGLQTVGELPGDEGRLLKREAVNKALAIDPEYALAHARLSRFANVYDNDLPAAARHLQRALQLEPGNTDIIFSAARLMASLGRLDEAIALTEFAVARDPVNPVGHFRLARSYIFVGRWDDAIESFSTISSLSPSAGFAQYNIGTALLFKGEPQAALEAMQRENSVWRLIGLPLVYHALGQTDESDAALAELIEQHERNAPFQIAYIYAWRGEADLAFEWLDKSVEYKDAGLFLIVTNRFFSNIHDDPRWLPFLESIGRSPEQLAAIEFKVTLPE